MTAPLKCPTCGHTEPTFAAGVILAFFLVGIWSFGFFIGWLLR